MRCGSNHIFPSKLPISLQPQNLHPAVEKDFLFCEKSETGKCRTIIPRLELNLSATLLLALLSEVEKVFGLFRNKPLLLVDFVNL